MMIYAHRADVIERSMGYGIEDAAADVKQISRGLQRAANELLLSSAK
jgi:hypothetical protein